MAVTAPGPEVALGPLADRLAASLSAFGPTLRLGSRAVDAQLGEGIALCPDGIPGHGRLAEWISDLPLISILSSLKAEKMLDLM